MKNFNVWKILLLRPFYTRYFSLPLQCRHSPRIYQAFWIWTCKTYFVQKMHGPKQSGKTLLGQCSMTAPPHITYSKRGWHSRGRKDCSAAKAHFGTFFDLEWTKLWPLDLWCRMEGGKAGKPHFLFQLRSVHVMFGKTVIMQDGKIEKAPLSNSAENCLCGVREDCDCPRREK